MRYPVIIAASLALVVFYAGPPATAGASAKPRKCRVAGHRQRAGSAAARRAAAAAKRCAERVRAEVASPPAAPAPAVPAPAATTTPAAAEGGYPSQLPPQSDPPAESTPPADTAPFVAEEATEEALPQRFFSPSSFWNTPVPEDAPLAPNSSAMVGAFDSLVASEQSAKTGPAINTTEYSVPIYTVPATQPTVAVRLDSPYAAPGLRSAWSAVPLPPNARPAAGRDHHLVVWQPSSDRLWEFWHIAKGSEGWAAAWGGAIQDVSASSGAYSPQAWPGATTMWGASATSLSIAGGLITFQDLRSGVIEHALAMSIPNTRAGAYSLPAQRGDGESNDPLSLPEGAHLRIDPNVNLAALHLPPFTLMLAEAAQRYGIFIRDTAWNVTFNAQDPVTTGGNPYLGAKGFFEGSYPQKLLASFPWHSLQLLAPG